MTRGTLLLSRLDVRRHLGMASAIATIEAVQHDLARGKPRWHNPLRQTYPLFDGTPPAFMGVMPAATWAYEGDEERFCSCKCLTIMPQNKSAPSVQGVLALFDGADGAPVMLVDAAEVTAVRTPALAAVAARRLAPAAACIGLVGSGVQAHGHALALSQVYPNATFVIWGRDAMLAQRCCDAIRKDLPNVEIAPQPLQDVVLRADLLCTVTSATEPVLTGAHLRRREGRPLPILAMGASTPTTRELDSDVVAAAGAPIVVDNVESAFAEAGDLLIPAREGRLGDLSKCVVPLSEIVSGQSKPPTGPATLFKSLGHGLLDLAVAIALYAQTRRDPRVASFDFRL